MIRKSDALSPLCPHAGAASTHREYPDCRILLIRALVAQRIEHLTTDQKVGGSSPSERAQVSGHIRGSSGPQPSRVQQRSTAADHQDSLLRRLSLPLNKSPSRFRAARVASSGT